ncbi:MAG: glycine cleavage system protein R [Spirochaetota bacterium]
MKRYAVLTAFGTDRVGIVDELSAALLEEGCNIEESRMSVLGGEFALIVLVSAEQEAVNRVLDGLGRLGGRVGLELSGRATSRQAANPNGRPYQIECVSLDTPGIVHSVTGLLRRFGVSVDELETETTGAPFTGAPMFHMRIMAIVPSDVSVAGLRAELAEVATSQDLDITVRPLIAGGSE